jgi:hypothetical protein
MKPFAPALLAALALASSGCARLHGRQTDISIEKDGTRREITTDLSGTTWFTSTATLSRFRASQTDKTQSFNGEDVKQHGATNSVEFLKQLNALIGALPK